ncbi:hypothetical protein BDV10DRAFT_132526 [Aspergillus recurvatus]
MRQQSTGWVDCQLVFPVCAAGQLLSGLSGFIHRAKQERHDIWASYRCRMGQLGSLRAGYLLCLLRRRYRLVNLLPADRKQLGSCT